MMASIQYLCLVAAVLIWGNTADTDAARLKRQSTNDFQLPFLQELQNWADQSSDQTLQSDAAEPNLLMEVPVSQVQLPSNPVVGSQTSQDGEADLSTLMKQVSSVVPNNQEMVPQDFNIDSLMQLMNSVQQTGKDRVELQLRDGEEENSPNSPSVSVVVETLSAEDLLVSEKGRQQLSQLNAQLELAMSSLSQSFQMMQGPEQVGTMIENFQNVSAGTMLGGLVNMLIGEDRDNVILGVLGAQSAQAVKQLTQTLDQLPRLKGILGQFSRFVEHLHTKSSSTAKDLQQLFTSAVMLLKGMNEGMGQHGMMMEIDAMMEMVLKGLTDKLELLEAMANKLQQAANNPSFLLAVNDTHCLIHGLKGHLNTNAAVGCLQQLMEALALVNQSEHMVSSLIYSLNHLLDTPDIMQTFTDLIKAPSMDKAFSMIQMMIGDLAKADKDVVNALQTLQNMIQTLLKNEPFVETLGNLLQNPQASQVYETMMQFLKDAAAGDPATQQLLQVVNDSITMMWLEGNPQNVVENIQEILTMLKNKQQTTHPLSESQQALLDLLNKLLKIAQNAINSETGTTQTPNPTVASTTTSMNTARTTGTKSSTTTTTTSSSLESSSQSSLRPQTSRTTNPTSQPGTTKVTGDGEGPPRSPAATQNPDTSDENGSAPVSLSALTLFAAAFLASVL